MYIKKIVTIILVGMIMLVTIGCTDANSSGGMKEISDKEWILQQDDLAAKYRELVESTDDIYSLYVSGSMAASDFANSLTINQSQLIYYKNEYEKKKGNLIIRTDNTDDCAKKGTDALEKLFEDLNALYCASETSTGEPYGVVEISYIYLNYKNEIVNDYMIYTDSVMALKGETSND